MIDMHQRTWSTKHFFETCCIFDNQISTLLIRPRYEVPRAAIVTDIGFDGSSENRDRLWR